MQRIFPLSALALTALLASISASASTEAAAESDIKDVGPVSIVQQPVTLPATWSQGPFMQIYVRGYKDSNGDGTGDLKGVTEKLDYIKSLGYTGIWLMPIFVSEDQNHGYAVKNYRDIEPRYGKMEDLKHLLDEAHKRGIGVILDYVINHSADRHPIYKASIDKNSPWRDWYVWHDGDKPEGWSGLNGESWYPGDSTSNWYYAVFWERMPDFNLKNPKVVDFHMNNLKFWLNQGVDGFRFDAVAYLVENKSIGWENQPENYKLMKSIQDLLGQYQGPKYMVCEATTDAAGFAAADGCGSAFSFGLQKAILKSVRYGRADRDLQAFVEKNPIGRMGTFLSNHDHFAGPRIFNQLEGDLKAYRIATATQFLLPGIPFTYYGEEIGVDMSTGAGNSDEQMRAPMPWNTDERVIDAVENKPYYMFGGFTRLTPEKRRKLFRPLPDNWKTANVATQEKDADSLLNFYRKLIALRKSSAALTLGGFQALSVQSLGETAPAAKGKKAKPAQWQDDARVFSFIRQHGDEKVLVAINYSDKEASVRVDTAGKKLARLTALWPEQSVGVDSDAKGLASLTIPGSGFAVYRMD